MRSRYSGAARDLRDRGITQAWLELCHTSPAENRPRGRLLVWGGCLMLVGGLLLGVSILALVDVAILRSGADISYVGLAFYGVPLFLWGLYLHRRKTLKKRSGVAGSQEHHHDDAV